LSKGTSKRQNSLYVKTNKSLSFPDGLFKKKDDDILSHITAVPSAQAELNYSVQDGKGEPTTMLLWCVWEFQVFYSSFSALL
jgi:hypothetical protein